MTTSAQYRRAAEKAISEAEGKPLREAQALIAAAQVLAILALSAPRAVTE